MIINKNLAELINFYVITDLNDPHNFRILYNHIETKIHGLKALGDFKTYGTILVCVLCQIIAWNCFNYEKDCHKNTTC